VDIPQPQVPVPPDGVARLFAWMEERHHIYTRRQAGQPPPWTQDKVLQQYKFTNVFRDLDRVSQDLIRHLRNHAHRPYKEQLFNICAYRMFNLPATWEELTDGRGWMKKWQPRVLLHQLDERKERGEKIFTGAYMMTGSGSQGTTKHSSALKTLSMIHTDSSMLVTKIRQHNSIQRAVELLKPYPMVSDFVAYEFATDLTYCKVLPAATDQLTWANPGPGARRGLNRIWGRLLSQPIPTPYAIDCMRAILQQATAIEFSPGGRKLVLRDIEHSLCEFDKYERVRLGQGTPRSKYNGRG